MLTLIISFAIGVLCTWAVGKDHGTSAGVFSGLGAMLVFQIIAGLTLRKLVNKKQVAVQEILMDAQNRIQKQINLFQKRPPSSQNAARQALEKIQNDAARKALEATDSFKPYYIWNLMLKKQINTMKMQLLFQLGEFKKVDEILPKCFLIDQQSLAIKMVRLYKTDDTQLAKFYKKKCTRLKGDACAFVASVYAWILLKQNNVQGAVDVLLTAKNKTDHPVVVENFERLANGKVKQFSNSGFGDIWYSLGLEEVKVKAQKQKMPRPF